MSSDDIHRVVYSSARRVVATNGTHVAELAGEGGWIRSIGTAGPMSGERIAILNADRWSAALSKEDTELVEFARAAWSDQVTAR